ncbi:hypothetical protein [Devosia sp.]|uniref:hypothetical protein n=1 Tax=Devosia sp. TaxID=1871048 RepID=UPI003BAC7A83
MRLLLALTLALLCLTPAEAASLAGTTQHSFIPGQGQVIEYLAADGSTLLWYPGNDRLAPGQWSLEGDEICFQYPNQYWHPRTRNPGKAKKCETLALYRSKLIDSDPGDIFQFVGRKRAPFILPPYEMPYSQIEAILDPSIVARERAAIPRCAEVLANANRSRLDTIQAAQIYFYGMRMGEICLKADYVKAFAMLDAIGETETRAAFYRELQYKAQSGSPKAIAALKKIKP